MFNDTNADGITPQGSQATQTSESIKGTSKNNQSIIPKKNDMDDENRDEVEEKVGDGRVGAELERAKLRKGFKMAVKDMFVEAFNLNSMVAAQTTRQRNEGIWKARNFVRNQSFKFEQPNHGHKRTVDDIPQRKRNRRSNKNRKQ